MALPFFKKKSSGNKRKLGKTSRLTERLSPYRHKMPEPTRKIRNVVRNRAAFTPPRSLNKPVSTGRWKGIMAFILAVMIAVFGLYSIFFTTYFHIQKFVLVEEGTVIDSYEKMNEILKKIIGENIWLINEDSLIQEIKTYHPEIEKVAIKKVFPETIRIEYAKYPTVANLENLVQGIQKTFLVDSQGFLVEENFDQPDLPHIRIETNEPLEVRSSFLNDPDRSAERLEYILNAVNLYEEKFGMKVLYAEFLPREREVHLYTEKYFHVMIDMEKDLNRQIEKLKKALSKLDIYNEPLVYIDLRISGTNTEKVIFKRK